MIKGRPILCDWLMRGAIAFQDGFFCDEMLIYFYFFSKSLLILWILFGLELKSNSNCRLSMEPVRGASSVKSYFVLGIKLENKKRVKLLEVPQPAQGY
jgi:hypothetical protein